MATNQPPCAVLTIHEDGVVTHGLAQKTTLKGKVHKKMYDDSMIEDIHSGVLRLKGDLEPRVTNLEQTMRARKFVGLPGVELERERFSFGKALVCAGLQAAGMTNCWKEFHAEFEHTVMTEARQQKTIDTGTGGAGGGYVIPQQYIAQIIELLRPNVAVIAAGARLMEGLVGTPVRIPKQTGSGTVYWVGQNAPITASDATFSEVQLTPKTMVCRMAISNLVGVLSNPALESLIKDDFASLAALELDKQALLGDGSGNAPTGVANFGSPLGTFPMGTDGAPLTRKTALQIQGVVEDANALRGKLAYIMHPKARRSLLNERIPQYSGDTGGMYVWQFLSGEALPKWIDYPIFTTTQLRSNLTKGNGTNLTELFFGNWDDLLIGQWGGVEVLATNVGGNAWVNNLVELRLVWNLDINSRHKQSFTYVSDISYPSA